MKIHQETKQIREMLGASDTEAASRIWQSVGYIGSLLKRYDLSDRDKKDVAEKLEEISAAARELSQKLFETSLKVGMSDFPMSEQVHRQLSNGWSSALEFIDKNADRAMDWFDQLLRRMKNDGYEDDANLIDRALHAVPLPASRQTRKGGENMNDRLRRCGAGDFEAEAKGIARKEIERIVGDARDAIIESIQAMAQSYTEMWAMLVDGFAEELGREMTQSEVDDFAEQATDDFRYFIKEESDIPEVGALLVSLFDEWQGKGGRARTTVRR